MLYEMVSGRRPFQGDSAVTTLAAVIEKEPAPLTGEIPAGVERVVARCLRKDPSRRYQHMADVRVELQDLVEESDSKQRPAARRRDDATGALDRRGRRLGAGPDGGRLASDGSRRPYPAARAPASVDLVPRNRGRACPFA